MITTPKNDNAPGQGCEVSKANQTTPKRTKKIDRVIAALRLPAGLNRFEAEGIGDHALNSTVAVIRDRYGDTLIQRWETVPTRYSPDGVRVLRYWLV